MLESKLVKESNLAIAEYGDKDVRFVVENLTHDSIIQSLNNTGIGLLKFLAEHNNKYTKCYILDVKEDDNYCFTITTKIEPNNDNNKS